MRWPSSRRSPEADRLKTREHPEGRGLAAAGRPEHAEELAVLDGEVEILDRDGAVRIGLAHLPEDDLRHGYLTAPKVSPRTRCLCSTKVKIMIGSTAIEPTAMYSPQASPIELEKPAR